MPGAVQLSRAGSLFIESKRKDGGNVKKPITSAQQKSFCQSYLYTMDPQRAAETAGITDGYALLKDRTIQQRLESMRETLRTQIRKEDVVRQLSQLAFGRTNGAVELALASRGTEPAPQSLDLSAVSEFRATDKGGIEIKFIDRIRALEVLYGLLGNSAAPDADAFFQALEDADQGSDEP